MRPATETNGLSVLHVIATRTRRGAEIFASDLVRELDARGVPQRVAILRASEHENLAFAAPVDILGPRAAGSTGPNMNHRTLFNLRRTLRNSGSGVIQAHGGEALKYSLLASAGFRIPIVYRRIGAAPQWITRGAKRVLHGNLMRRAQKVVTVAEALRAETIVTFGVPQDRVVTIANAIDVSRAEPQVERRETRRRLGIPPDAPVMVSLGALVWEKDPFAHLDVATKVMKQRPDVFHILAGDGPLRSQLEAAVRQRGLDGRVLLLGSRGDVPDLLAAGDILLFASSPDGMEGMPAQVIEAGAAGLPVVGFSIAGVPEVVLDAETGLLTKPGDIGGLAAGVLSLLGDPQARLTLGRAAKQRCRSQFDVRVIASRYVDVYGSLARVP